MALSQLVTTMKKQLPSTEGEEESIEDGSLSSRNESHDRSN
jgi:hypothetical protein